MNYFENNLAQAQAFAALSESIEGVIPVETRISLPLATLKKLSAIETPAVEFFAQKFAGYRLNFDEEKVPEIIYETISDPKPYNSKSIGFGGYFQMASDGSSFIYILRAHDPLTTATLAAHEISHALAFNGYYAHPTSENSDDFMLVQGLEQQLLTGDMYTREYAAIENGMAVMDQIQIRKEILQGIFTDDTKRIYDN